MALFRGIAGPIKSTKDQYMRTNTKLQAGTHDAPGERYLIDPRLKRLFRYHFGGDGWVVIPKGRIVAPSTDNDGVINMGNVFDFDGNVYRPALTLANGGVDVVEIGKDGTQHTRAANKAIALLTETFMKNLWMISMACNQPLKMKFILNFLIFLANRMQKISSGVHSMMLI